MEVVTTCCIKVGCWDQMDDVDVDEVKLCTDVRNCCTNSSYVRFGFVFVSVVVRRWVVPLGAAVLLLISLESLGDVALIFIIELSCKIIRISSSSSSSCFCSKVIVSSNDCVDDDCGGRRRRRGRTVTPLSTTFGGGWRLRDTVFLVVIVTFFLWYYP